MAARRKKHEWWRDDENILILNAGAVTLAVPRSWEVEGKAEGFGYLNIKDPSDSCALQVSCLAIPPLVDSAPPIDHMLREVLQKDHPAVCFAPVHVSKRGPVDVAWLDYAYDEKDTERDEWRVARARVLFARNAVVGTLLTFNYWQDDTAWAIPAWERMVETLRLAASGGLLQLDPRTRHN